MSTLSRRQLLKSVAAGAGTAAYVKPAWSAVSRDGVLGGTVGRLDRVTGSRAPLPGVIVSNGTAFALSGADGRWTLQAREGDVIFAVKPAHHAIAPGRPFWRRIATSSALEMPIDFDFIAAPEPDDFDVLLLADPQAADMREAGYVRSVVHKAVRELKPAFAIVHGDITGDDLTLLADFEAMTRETGIAWHQCPGNHDMDLQAECASRAFETWKHVLGPPTYAFHVACATFIIINNVEPLLGQGRLGYNGAISEEDFEFIATVLRGTPRGNLVVLSMHIPLVSFDNPSSKRDTTRGRERLLALLSDFPNTVSFAGHAHTTEHHYLGRGHGFGRDVAHHHHVLTAACGSWWSGPHDAAGIPLSISRDGSPKGCHVLSVSKVGYRTRFAAFDDEPDGLARTIRSPDGERLLVDVFDGGPRTTVSCRLPGKPATSLELERQAMTDPLSVAMFADHAHLCKPWVTASLSSHIWSGELTGDMIAAEELELTICDEYGITHTRLLPVARRLAAN